MKKALNDYDINCELKKVKHLLFFMNESLTVVQEKAELYREAKPEAAMKLAYESNRSIDQLKTLQDLMLDSVMSLEKNFEEK